MDTTEHGLNGGEEDVLRNEPNLPAPDDPPWNTCVAILVWISSVLAILLIPSLLVAIYVLPQAGAIGGQEQMIEFVKTDKTAVLIQILGIIPAHLVTILLAWLVVTKFRQFSFRESLGWGSGGVRWWHYAVILIGIFGLSGFVLSFFPESDNDLIRMLKTSRAAVFAVAALATLTAPIVEEVVYRGILYSAFRRAAGVGFAVAIVTFLFAVVHFPQYWPSYSTLFLLIVLSLTLTMVRVRSGNLLPCIILHTLFNGIQSLLLIAEPYVTPPDPALVQSIAVLLLK